MAGFIAGEDRQQAVLFPERLDDLVPADALVRVIDGFVSGLDLAALGFVRARASGIGRPGYDPTDLLGLYLYGYMKRGPLEPGVGACMLDQSGAGLVASPVAARFQDDRGFPQGQR